MRVQTQYKGPQTVALRRSLIKAAAADSAAPVKVEGRPLG